MASEASTGMPFGAWDAREGFGLSDDDEVTPCRQRGREATQERSRGRQQQARPETTRPDALRAAPLLKQGQRVIVR